MANTKKSTAAEKIENKAGNTENTPEKIENVEKTAENITDIKTENGRLSLFDLSKIVNTVVDSVFVERNGNIEFAAELYEVLLAYMEIGAFYPNTGVFENSLDLFFIDYIDGKYHKELGKLKYNRLAQYIDNAVKQKVDAKMRQIENPLINSIVEFVNVATVLAQKYVDDIDNVGAADIQKFIKDFGSLAKKTNPQTVTEAVIKMHRAENAKDSETNRDTKQTMPTTKKQSTKLKKSEE